MARLSSQSNTCDCRNQYMISDHSSDSKGIIAGWQTDLEVRTRWKWWTLWRRNSTQHYTFSMAALIKAWSSAETTQQRERERQRVRNKRPVFFVTMAFSLSLQTWHTGLLYFSTSSSRTWMSTALALGPVIFGTNCFMVTAFTVNMLYCDIHPKYFSPRSAVCYKLPMPAVLRHRLDQSLRLSVLKLKFCPGVSELVCIQEDPLLIHVKLCKSAR